MQRQVFHAVHRRMAATLDGRIEATGAVFEAKFMLPWAFSEEAAAEKHMPQLQHNMWVTAARTAVLSVIPGGGKWVEIKVRADPLHQHLLLTAERKFWRAGEFWRAPAPVRPGASQTPPGGRRAHLRYVAAQSCLICGRTPCDAYHVKMAQPQAMGRIVPICRIHHRDCERLA